MRKRKCLSTVVSLLLMKSIKQALAHGDLPNETIGEPSFPIFVAIGAGIITAIFPLVFGMLVPRWINTSETSLFKEKLNLDALMNGISFGFLLFLFYDFGVLSNFAGLNSSDRIIKTVLPMIFFGGLIFAKFSGVLTEEEGATWALVWFVGIAFHSTAEGIIMGSNFLLPEPDVLRPFAAISFIFHKFAEGFVAGILLTKTEWREGKQIASALISSSFVLLGIFGGYYNVATFGKAISYLYTITLVTIILILIHIPLSFKNKNPSEFYQFATLGLLLMYLFTILHEV